MIKKSILAVGSIGIDWLELPNKISGKTIGGSLTYFTRTAGLNSKVNIVGIIGDDYPTEGKKLFDEFGNNLDDLQIVKGKNFSWGGKYHELVTGTSKNPKPHFDLVIDDKAKRIEEL